SGHFCVAGGMGGSGDRGIGIGERMAWKIGSSATIAKASLIWFAVLTSSISAVPQNPVPFIDSLSPVAMAPGSEGFTLTVNGAGFVPGAVVSWRKGASQTILVTTFVSATKLTAAVPAALIAAQGTASIAVANPFGGQSNAILFPLAKPTASVSMGGP